jgi:NADH-quinone oxidoreductase subunit J
MLETVLFYLISFGVLVFALGVITARSAIYGVLSLVATMCMMAGLFVLMKAFLVATILVLVYAGAILVLFLFVVMLLDFRQEKLDWGGFSMGPVAAIGVAALLFAQTFAVVRGTVAAHAEPAVQGTAEALGRALFSRYVLPFELTSFLLLAAVVAVVVLAKKDAR